MKSTQFYEKKYDFEPRYRKALSRAATVSDFAKNLLDSLLFLRFLVFDSSENGTSASFHKQPECV